MAGTGEAGAAQSSGSGSSQGSEYVVRADGTIIFPVLGTIYCKGMTQQQLKEDLESLSNAISPILWSPLPSSISIF